MENHPAMWACSTDDSVRQGVLCGYESAIGWWYWHPFESRTMLAWSVGLPRRPWTAPPEGGESRPWPKDRGACV